MCGATSEINASTVDAARVALRHLSYLDMLFSRHSPAHITATAFGGAHVIKCVVLQTFAAGRANRPRTFPLPSPDLHSHSTYSDGTLTPAALVARAAGRGLTALALTDHDETAGLAEARKAAQEAGLRLIDGVEISV